jgi:hypothetical protein
MPYYFGESNDRLVELWTSCDLQNEGNNESKRYREDLCGRLRQLTAGMGLHGTYTCLKWPQGCDLDNLLLYNVSQSGRPFGQRQFLLCEKKVVGKLPPCCKVPEAVAYVRYEIIAEHGVTPPQGRMLAECETVPCKTVNFGNGPGPLWKIFKEASWRRGKAAWDGASDLELHLVVRGPAYFRVVKSEHLKRVLDGLFSALHYRCQTDTTLNDVVDRIVSQDQELWRQGIPWDSNKVRRLLLDSAGAVLGRHDVPRCYGDGLMWDPKDHFLARCQIVHETSRDGVWTLKGSLYL